MPRPSSTFIGSATGRSFGPSAGVTLLERASRPSGLRQARGRIGALVRPPEPARSEGDAQELNPPFAGRRTGGRRRGRTWESLAWADATCPALPALDGPRNRDSLDRELRIIRWSCRAPEYRSIEGPPPVNDGYRDRHGIGWSEPVEEPAAPSRNGVRPAAAGRHVLGRAGQCRGKVCSPRRKRSTSSRVL